MKNTLQRQFLFLVIMIVLCLQAIAQQPVFITDSLDNYIKKGMADWDVPGLSIVVVKDGRIVVMKGYGVTNIETGSLVDDHTLFMIASNTKLFTGTALALLDYRHRISLDDRITRYFPQYRLYDHTATSLVTIRDMLSHRIGTKTFQGDFTFWNSTLSRKEIMNRMRLLKPSQHFRQDFGYCNSCFLTAGQVIPKVTGRSWEDFVHDSIIAPLHMNNTYTSLSGIGSGKNVATPYTTNFTGTLKVVPYDRWDNLAPAASIVSNVHDLANWLFFQLDSGRFESKRVMPFDVLQKTRAENTSISSRKSVDFPTHFRGYGLGIFLSDYNGHQIFWHTGGAAGMVSNVCFVPEERLGIAILTNNDNQNFFEALRYQILDAYLGVPYINRSLQQIGRFRKGMQEQLAEIAGWNKRVKGKQPPLPLEKYTGEYTNPLYGSITIKKEDDHLTIKFNTHDSLVATLKYMDNKEWLLSYNNIEYGIFSTGFKVSAGKVQSLTIKENDFVELDPYVFSKH